MSNSDQSVDPNSHAEKLARISEQMAKVAQEQATEARSGYLSMLHSSDPNIVAQALAHDGDPNTMPPALKAAYDEAIKNPPSFIKEGIDISEIDNIPVPDDNVDEPEKLHKGLLKALEDGNLSPPEQDVQAHEEEIVQVEHVDTPVKADNDYQPPSGTGEDIDSSYQRPDVQDHWDPSNNGETGPEGSWPDAVYDPNNAEGTNVEEGQSYADEPQADFGNYDDVIYNAEKPEHKEEETPVKAEEEHKEETPVKAEEEHKEETPVEAEEEHKEQTPVEAEEEHKDDVQDDEEHKDEEGQWVDHDNDPSTPEIFIKGAKFGNNSPKKEDARTQDVIIANHIDHKRDEKIGIDISHYNLNYIFADPDERDHKFKAVFGAPDPAYLPAKTDLRPTWGTILDQLDLGSCVANSVSYCIRYCFRKQKLGEFTPSRLFIYFNGRLIAGYPVNEDTGLTIRDGYKSVTKYSACSEGNWPYVPNKFSQRPPDSCYLAAKQHQTFRYISLENDLTQMKKSLKDGFPISFGAALFESFMSASTAKSGIIPMPKQKTEKRVGGHAMTIIGHDDSKKAFLVVNNWGDKWGFGGCCWFPYDYMVNDDLVGDLWSPRYFGA